MRWVLDVTTYSSALYLELRSRVDEEFHESISACLARHFEWVRREGGGEKGVPRGKVRGLLRLCSVWASARK